MLWKKECPNCGEKVKDSYDYCPHCGDQIEADDDDDWGLLGREDEFEQENLSRFMNSGFFDRVIGNTMKMMEKEMRHQGPSPLGNFRLMINGREINLNGKKSAPQKKIKFNQVSEEAVEKLAKLPREEPKSRIKRLSEKVVCELEVPGVESLKDVILINLESSLEIKAIAEDKIYVKVIPIKTPLRNYFLEKEKLFLEFEPGQ